jgi:phage gp45-like
MSLFDKAKRAIQMVVAFATVTADANDAGPVQLVQVQMFGAETRDGLPNMQQFGFASSAPIGSVGVAVFINGDRSNGALIASGNAALRPTGLLPGEVMIYDAFGNKFHMQQGKIRLTTPLLEVTGDIIDNCLTQPNTWRADRAIYDVHTHPTPDGESGPPTAPE